MMRDDFLPVLDLYERHTSDGEIFLTGAFGGGSLGLCLDLAGHRFWWWTACAPHSAGKPDSYKAFGAPPIGPGPGVMV
jgi:hypothetical protein